MSWTLLGLTSVNIYPKVGVGSLNLGFHDLTTILPPLQSCDSRSSLINHCPYHKQNHRNAGRK